MSAFVIKVAVGLLSNSQNQFLLSKRPFNKPMAHLWEFPGGKIEALETPIQALKRELKEELNINISEKHTIFLDHIEYQYPNLLFQGEVFVCTHWTGKIKALENQGLKWIHLSQLLLYDTLPTCSLICKSVLKKTNL